jgi:hypothetical protein
MIYGTFDYDGASINKIICDQMRGPLQPYR